MGKKKKKYNFIVGEPDFDFDMVDDLPDDASYESHARFPNENDPPAQMDLANITPGFYLGPSKFYRRERYVGIQQGAEGNIVIVGGNGSGKSSGIVAPTLATWAGAVCATDVKGELSSIYAKLFSEGIVTRPYIVFDPMQVDGPSYDPFWWIDQAGEDQITQNVEEIAFALIPAIPNDPQPFWANTERSVLSASLLHYYELGLGFSEALSMVMLTPIQKLCECLETEGSLRVQAFIGSTSTIKKETLVCVERGLRNKLTQFVVDPFLSHAFRGHREDANCFTWNDLDHYQIFLRVPAERIEQWSGAINLLYTQLIRHLERRPDQFSSEDVANTQTLLLMDEMARFGKLESLIHAMSTLRSKNVNMCLVIQSLAQLDKLYGFLDRRVIIDNCQFQVLLRANDAETQKYFADLIGTSAKTKETRSDHYGEDFDLSGTTTQYSSVREWTVFPHQLAFLEDVLVVSPFRFFRTEKLVLNRSAGQDGMVSELKPFKPVVTVTVADSGVSIKKKTILNGGAKMLTIEERNSAANAKAQQEMHARRLKVRQDRENEEKLTRRRCYAIGEIVLRYFPELNSLVPGRKEDNAVVFQSLERFLECLASDHDLINQVAIKANCECLLSDSSAVNCCTSTYASQSN